MFIIKKMINNNALLVTDTRFQEYVVMGSGIGFQKHVNDYVDESLIEKKFLLDKGSDKESIIDLITTSNKEIFLIIDEVIQEISSIYKIELFSYQYYSLLDHLVGSISRMKNNISIAVNEEIDVLGLETELVIAGKISQIIMNNVGMKLNRSEIYAFAIHINNAINDITLSNLNVITVNVIRDIKAILDKSLEVNTIDSFYYNRFLLHIKFFVIRCQSQEANQVDERNPLLVDMMSNYPKEYKIVREIQKDITSKYGWKVSDDEVLYLLLHIIKFKKGV